MVTSQVSSVGVTCDYRFLLYFLLKYDNGTITRDESGRVPFTSRGECPNVKRSVKPLFIETNESCIGPLYNYIKKYFKKNNMHNWDHSFVSLYGSNLTYKLTVRIRKEPNKAN